MTREKNQYEEKKKGAWRENLIILYLLLKKIISC
jgi:hypothetical protein